MGIINSATEGGLAPASCSDRNTAGIVVIVLALALVMYVYLRYSASRAMRLPYVGESVKNTARYAGINVSSGDRAHDGHFRRDLRNRGLHSRERRRPYDFDRHGAAAADLRRSSSHGCSKLNTFAMMLVSFLLVFMEKGAIQIASQFNLNENASEMFDGHHSVLRAGLRILHQLQSETSQPRQEGGIDDMNAIIIFIQKAIGQGIGILFGANGRNPDGEIGQPEPWACRA